MAENTGRQDGKTDGQRFEQVRELLKDNFILDAAEELDRIAMDEGLESLRREVGDAIRETRSIERDALSISPAEGRAIRSRVYNYVWKLTNEVEARAKERTDRAEPAPKRPSMRPVPTHASGPEPLSGTVASFDNVVKRYGDRFQLGPVSFSLGYGQMLAVVGANGSGKTALLRMLAGELAADEGTCAVARRNATKKLVSVHRPISHVMVTP